jgi:hypothetical protein
MEDKENKEHIEREQCWICKRTFDEALEEFNKKILSSKYIDEDVKSKYEKGKKEFFPYYVASIYEDFEMADIEGDKLSVSGKILGEIRIPLCPVCNGLLESLMVNIDTDEFVTKEDLENACIKL